MRKILAILGAGILFLPVVYLGYLGNIIWLDFWTTIAVAFILMAFGLLAWGFEPEITRRFKDKTQRFDARFNHVDAWLFYRSEISWARKERDPKKHIPREKLVCNTVTRKAYYVDSVIWRMILEDQIRWHTEDVQDLEEWCKKNDYKLVKRDAREVDLLQLSESP